MLFSGFIGGSVFITKKGFKGSKIDSLWVRNLFDSFETDDEELAEIAMQSSIADIHERVTGGLDGAPFSIGEYPFYADSQFEYQAKILQAHERKISSKAFISNADWAIVDKKLAEIASISVSRFRRGLRGDTFAALSIRKSAFLVTKMMIDRGVDPLLCNEDEEDVMSIVKQQYGFLTSELKKVQEFIIESSMRVIAPTIIEEQARREEALIEDFNKMVRFLDSMIHSLQERLTNIEKDRLLLRAYALKKEEPPEFNAWNASQLDKAQQYLLDCEELKAYVLEKLTIHEIHTRNYQNLADVLKVQYEFIGEFDSAAQSLSSSSASYVLEKMKKKQSGQSSSDRLLQMQTSEESKNDDDSFSSKKSKKSKKSVFELNQAKKMEALNSKRHTLASKSMKLPPLLESPTSPKLDLALNSPSSGSKSVGSGQFSPLPLQLAPVPSSAASSPMTSSRSSLSTLTGRGSNDPTLLRHMSKEELYSKLGLVRGGRRGPHGGSDLVSIAESTQLEEYAPILGTLKETKHSTIMYR